MGSGTLWLQVSLHTHSPLFALFVAAFTLASNKIMEIKERKNKKVSKVQG